jgi:chromosome transmission fidelity protein 1
VRLAGAVLIVDEAHNLPEAVADAAAAAVTGAACGASAAAIAGYLTRYRARLSPGNLRHLGTLLVAARALQRAVAAPSAAEAGASVNASASVLTAASADAARVLQLSEFLFEAGIDHLNLFKLARYCRERRVPAAMPCGLI